MRSSWRQTREEMERTGRRCRAGGSSPTRYPAWKRKGIRLGIKALEATGLDRVGRSNALNLQARHIDLRFASLPASFEGIRILHASDFHWEMQPEASARFVDLVGTLEFDVAFLTGDFLGQKMCGSSKAAELSVLPIRAMASKAPVISVLGNHDPAAFCDILEDFGVTVLVNESCALVNDRGDRFLVTGTDDVSRFHTPAADDSLQDSHDCFSVALVHSNDLADRAAGRGYDLYLSGHTHGGQICLPGGIPLGANRRKRGQAYGLWRKGRMTGYTTSGVGTSGYPVRFNRLPEAAIFRLLRV